MSHRQQNTTTNTTVTVKLDSSEMAKIAQRFVLCRATGSRRKLISSVVFHATPTTQVAAVSDTQTNVHSSSVSVSSCGLTGPFMGFRHATKEAYLGSNVVSSRSAVHITFAFINKTSSAKPPEPQRAHVFSFSLPGVTFLRRVSTSHRASDRSPQ